MSEASFNQYYITDEGKIYTATPIYHDDMEYNTFYKAGEPGSAEKLKKLFQSIYEDGKKARSSEIGSLLGIRSFR